MLGLTLLGFAGSAMAIEKAELDNRIRTLTAKLVAMQQKPDKSIPAETLSRARGIILLDRTKAGFIFAYQGGGGVALVKDAKTDQWSPAAFLGAHEASLGFQVGGQQSFFVILLMNADATRFLTEPNFEFGGEARGTAGNQTAGVAGTVASPEQAVMVFDDRQGLYGGAAIKGGAISPDEEANRAYYAQYVTMKDILFDNKVKPTDAATELAGKISEFSKAAQKPQTAQK
jgi:lipid-binding SYLF domain-containing protein